MSSAIDSFTERSLLYRRTKLLCPASHGIQPALTIDSDGRIVLECGCVRGPALPLKDGRVSVEALAFNRSRAVLRLFPASFDDEFTTQRNWLAA